MPNSTSVDLKKCSQSQLAALIGKRPRWIRESADRLPRNLDGSYDLAEVVRAMAGSIEPAELSDEHLEGALILADYLASSLENARRGGIRILTEIKQRYGSAGLAAVGELFLAEIERYESEVGPSLYCEPPTAEKIRADAEAQIAALPEWGSYNDLRTVGQCSACKRYRWGRKWLKPPWPRGYNAQEMPCPDCPDPTRPR